MATIRTVDLSEQCFNNIAFAKPPIPSRPSSGKFQIRGSGKIFRNTQQNELYSQSDQKSPKVCGTRDHKPDNTDNTLALVVHPEFIKEDTSSNLKKEKVEPSYRRQTKSAKARTSPTVNNNIKNRQTRPFSAGSAINRTKNSVNGNVERVPVIYLSDKVIPDLFEIEKERLLALPESRPESTFPGDHPPMHFTRPFSAHFEQELNEKCFCKREALPKKIAKGLKPSVYGLQHNRHVYGSAPDLRVKESDSEKCPYKLTTAETDATNSRSKDFCKNEIPTTLEPLIPWLNDDAPEDLIGVDPSTCLVFLPPCSDWSDIPEVPDLQDTDADLPYLEDVTTPKPWKPKKYQHPFVLMIEFPSGWRCLHFENSKQSVDEWVCNHRNSSPEPMNGEWHTVYRKTIRMPRMRTAEMVRKEIADLENLMKGIGTQDSECGMVQYQSEITEFKEALQVTLGMVPERLKNPAQPVDRFGMKKFFREHDEIITKVRQKMQACREELAELELEAGIATDRQYFRKRSNSIL